MIFKRKAKPYKNVSFFVTAGELRQFLETMPDDAHIKTHRGLVTEMHYHEITGIFLS